MKKKFEEKKRKSVREDQRGGDPVTIIWVGAGAVKEKQQ